MLHITTLKNFILHSAGLLCKVSNLQLSNLNLPQLQLSNLDLPQPCQLALPQPSPAPPPAHLSYLNLCPSSATTTQLSDLKCPSPTSATPATSQWPQHHTAAFGNSSCIVQDNGGSCNPVLVMSLREWSFSIELLCLTMYFPVLYFNIQSKTSH